MTVNDKDRAFITSMVEALDLAEGRIRKRGWKSASAQAWIAETRGLLFEHFDVETLGPCEGCSELLFAGDLGYRYDDGITCEDCAPTWADVKENLEDFADAFDPEDLESGLAALAAHLGGDGSLADKYTFKL